MSPFYSYLCAGCCIVALAPPCFALTVLTDQVGYEANAPKVAIIMGTEQDRPERFSLIEIAITGDKAVLEGTLAPAGQVRGWGRRLFWKADFSSWKKPGVYVVEARENAGYVRSCTFAINNDLLERKTLSNVIYYFKGQRASGALDRADRHLRLPDGRGFVDLHGGWYDATGDYGIHLSQLNFTSYFNTQQVPLVAWSLLKSYRVLDARKNPNFSEYERRMLDEGLFGADFLVRMKRPHGSFFQDINAPGVGKLPQDRTIGNPNWRPEIKKRPADAGGHVAAAIGPYAYQVSFRSGGGMAIAALALASTMPDHGDFSNADYLQAAEQAFAFLSAHNRELLNDHTENILDDYCALMAATELYRATRNEVYRAAAGKRALSLMNRLVSKGRYHNYWRADNGTRPFFNPSDAGLPVVSLLEYFQIASPANRRQVKSAVKRSLAFELAATADVNNPFGYARQLVRMGNGTVRTAFFFPHDTEAAPWWQGEDARIASLAAAARMASPLFVDDPRFQKQLESYAWNQLHWILGRNPFNICLLVGSGHTHPVYMFFKSYKYTSAPGAIVNGITAGLQGEDSIAWDQGYAVTGQDTDWRWTERWLPHDAWYLYAVSLPSE